MPDGRCAYYIPACFFLMLLASLDQVMAVRLNTVAARDQAAPIVSRFGPRGGCCSLPSLPVVSP